MAKFYSRTTNGFYDSAINTTMPPDAVAVTDAAYTALFAAQASGQVIQADTNGNPEAVVPAAPSTAQIAVNAANAALVSGVQITSTSTPELNARYALTEKSQGDIDSVTTYILANGTFPRGQTTTLWPDANGEVHTFPSVAVFKDFATKIADFVDAVEDYMNSGGTSGSIPSSAITII